LMLQEAKMRKVKLLVYKLPVTMVKLRTNSGRLSI
jgi:hypothetical protein